MQEYFGEGQLVGDLQTHHDHPGDPEEQDVVAGFEECGWLEVFVVGMLGVGPLQ